MGGVSLLLFVRHSALHHTRADTGRSIALFWLAPAGIRRFIVSCSVKALNGLLTRQEPRFSPRGARPHHNWEQAVSFLCHCRDSRHPYLHTAACPEGGGTFLSDHKRPPSAALSLSREHMRERSLIKVPLLHRRDNYFNGPCRMCHNRGTCHAAPDTR